MNGIRAKKHLCSLGESLDFAWDAALRKARRSQRWDGFTEQSRREILRAMRDYYAHRAICTICTVTFYLSVDGHTNESLDG
jgi:acyl-CoA reductase-like NAD-dependent aldehyde dehydrogenase